MHRDNLLKVPANDYTEVVVPVPSARVITRQVSSDNGSESNSITADEGDRD